VLTGDDISSFFWSDTEKTTFASEFISQVSSTWSGQHQMSSTKPCWEHYSALPMVHVVQVDDAASAHYNMTIHKVSDAELPFVYRSAINNENLSDPAAQPTGDLWETDTASNANFRSRRVATDERKRIDAAIAAAGAGRIQFEKDSAVVPPGERGKLDQLASALNQVYPNAPRIPLDLTGWASAEGTAARNNDLSLDRALAVERYLSGRSVPQPLTSIGFGATGAPNDVANRRVDVATDTTFESTYADNDYSVGVHEFGHMLGLTDEYRATETGLLAGARTNYETLMTSAGVEKPRWGEDTSSIISAGVDVLPRHYVTIWEALGRMTEPDILQDQWHLG
jgi:outer membrane protein OmpA-like peptidoglycan-associated protein